MIYSKVRKGEVGGREEQDTIRLSKEEIILIRFIRKTRQKVSIQMSKPSFTVTLVFKYSLYAAHFAYPSAIQRGLPGLWFATY